MWTAVRFRVQMFWMKYLKHKVSQNVSVSVCSCGFVCWRACVCLIVDSQVVLWGIENSLQTTQCPWCKHTICHHRLQCEISLPADFTPAIFPDSLEQIVIRDN